MNGDLMALADDAALFVGVQQRRDRRYEKRRLDLVFVQELEDARHADPRAHLAPGEPADRLAALAQIAGLMIAVERQRHRAARAARPFRRPQRLAGAHPVDQLAPMRLRPLPRFEIRMRPFGAHEYSLRGEGMARREMVGAERFELSTLSTPC